MNQQSTTSNWNDFNDAESQQSGFDLILKPPSRNGSTPKTSATGRSPSSARCA